MLDTTFRLETLELSTAAMLLQTRKKRRVPISGSRLFSNWLWVPMQNTCENKLRISKFGDWLVANFDCFAICQGFLIQKA